MPKTSARAYSRYSRDAIELLGGLIRAARKERRQTAQDLADRAGVSRGLLQRIERGDPKCGIGTVFEVAAIVGIKLFEADERLLSRHLSQTKDKLALLPKTVRKKSHAMRDDF